VNSATGRLHGKCALITGAGTGIGASIARRFHAEGAKVAITDRDAKSAERLAEELGDGAIAITLDVTQQRDWSSAVIKVERELGSLGILVNNAGVCIAGTVEELSLDQWDVSHRINLDGVFHGIRACLPLMRSGCVDGLRGSILNISSISGIIAGANLAAYNSSKAAVRHLTKSVALQCAREGGHITCNSLHPAFVETGILDAFAGSRSRQETLDKLSRQIPLGRIGQPEDVASAAVYLCSDEASFVTGAELVLDGGLSAA
jgi:NAD(P)-dependent dehydrogenase (short-subunit alcohol dehydrogenase family)